MTKAQSSVVTISLLSDSAPRVRVEGECPPNSVWSFRKNYADVMDLGQRIEKLELRDATGKEILVRRLAPGEFEAAAPASKFSYEVGLAPPIRSSDAAFVSWISVDRGLFMLGDLVPAFFDDPEALSSVRPAVDQASNRSNPARYLAKLRFVLPSGWAIESIEHKNHLGEFEVSNISQAVFVTGRSLRRTKNIHITGRRIGSIDLKLIASGDWAFDDNEAIDLAGSILQAHAEVFGVGPSGPTALILMPFPAATSPEKWSAETRGSTVTLLLGKQPSKTAALAQLSVPLTHELFHLWVPNALALQGDYDWFYEGFTVYQAARTAVRSQLLSFEDFLNGIARAYDIYRSSAQPDRYSLVEASHQRWSSSQTTVYQKAMLVAFLYDLKLRLQSGGKHSLDDVYRELFRRHRVSIGSTTGAKQIRSVHGTEATIAVLNGSDGMQAFAATFIERTVALDLESELPRFGLQVEQTGRRSRVSVNDRLNKSQRDLLRQLGYNDAARSKERVRSRRG